MAKTDIEYLDYTWNIAPGCTKVSPGCAQCWAEMMAKRLAAMGQESYQGLTDERGRWTDKVNMLADKLEDPLRMKKPRRIGVNYMGDLFHLKVTPLFILATFEVMRRADWHTYYVLTKRPERASKLLRMYHLGYGGHSPQDFQHVLIGTTVENMAMARKRVVPMIDIHEMGFRTWVSYEPALGSVYWGPWIFIEFMVAGGESGPKAKPMHPDWARKARDFCVERGIKFFFKQWGEYVPHDSFIRFMNPLVEFPKAKLVEVENMMFSKVGKKKAGRKLDGKTWEEMPPQAPIPSPSPTSRGRGRAE